MFDRLFAQVRPFHKYIIGAAWFFVGFSLLNLVWVVGSKLGSPAGPTALYQTIVGDETYRAIGLSYTGVIGILWAMLQGGVILTAAAATILPWRITDKQRRIAHVVLCNWAGLWTLNLMWLTSLDHRIDSYAQAAIMALLFGCTTYRAACGWSDKKRLDSTVPSHDEPEFAEQDVQLKIADHDPLAAEDIGTSERMHEIPSYELPAAPAAPGAPTSAWRRWVRATKTLAQSGFKRSKPLAQAGVGKIRGAGRRVSNYLRAHGVLPRPNRSTAA
ncbi:MAG: hypothetical protein IIA64_06755 [Planctomycetes bacterium]|nr:hypothetical protein [Planctomycetota bacterium]